MQGKGASWLRLANRQSARFAARHTKCGRSTITTVDARADREGDLGALLASDDDDLRDNRGQAANEGDGEVLGKDLIMFMA